MGKKVEHRRRNKLSVDLGNFIADNLRSLAIKECSKRLSPQAF